MSPIISGRAYKPTYVKALYIAPPHLARRHFQPADELLRVIMCRDVLRPQRRSHLLRLPNPAQGAAS